MATRNKRLWRTQLETTLQADRFDLMDWHSAGRAIPWLEGADDRAAAELCGHPVQDAYFSLYKRQPRLANPAPAGLEPLSDLLERGMETPNWERLRACSVGDRVAAGVGAKAFVEETLKALPEQAKEAAREQARASQRALEDETSAQALRDLAGMLADKAQQTDDPAEAGVLSVQAEQVRGEAIQAEQQAATAREQAQRSLEDYLDQIEQQSAQVQAAMNAAAEKAQSEATQASELAGGFSMAAGGDPQNVDPETAWAAMQAIQQNPNLKALAEMLGWAKRTVRGEWRQSPRGKTAFVGYKVGALNPETMAPVEWAALLGGDPTLEQDWTRRAVDGAIRHRDFEGTEQQGRGPLVVVRDESGSMSGPQHALAVALEWALLEIAQRDRRDFYSIPFSGRGQYHVWQAPRPGNPDPQGLLDHLAHFYGGGTDPYPPMVEAMRMIAAGDLRADVLVITDAAFPKAPPEFLEGLAGMRAARPLRIETVVVGANGGAADEWSDRVTQVGDLVRDRDKIKTAVSGVV